MSIYFRYKLRADKLIALLVACNHKYFALYFLKSTIQWKTPDNSLHSLLYMPDFLWRAILREMMKVWLSNWYMTNTEKINWIRQTAVNRLPTSRYYRNLLDIFICSKCCRTERKDPSPFCFQFIHFVCKDTINTCMWSVLYKLNSTVFFLIQRTETRGNFSYLDY